MVYGLLLLSSCNVAASNATMKAVFSEMPDSLIPYISRNNRLDMVDFIESNMKAEVTNTLNGKTELLAITDNYLKLQLNDAVVVEMKLLDTQKQMPDTTNQIICVVTTYGGTPAESKIDFYTSKWNRVETVANPLKGIKGSQLVAKSDSVTADEYTSIDMQVNDVMVVATLSPNDNSLTLSPFLPLLTSDEKKTFEKCKRLIQLKWNGYIFNEG